MKNISIIKTMKKVSLIPFFVLLLIISACEEVVDLTPYSSIAESKAFSSPTYIDLTVIGMYNSAQRGDYGGAGRGYPFGAAFVEQGDCRGEDAVNLQAFYQFTYEGTYTTSTANNQYYWSDTYRLINRANIIIDGVKGAVSKGIITQAVANPYLGEAYFMRAISHLELLFHFARPYKHTVDASHPGVPYRTIGVTNDSTLAVASIQGRNTVAECYQKIIADLDLAETLLPAKSGRPSGNTRISRATKGAAIAMKTRAYLHMWDWNKVISEFAKLPTTGADAYSLTADPSGPFAAGSNLNNTESIFSIEHSATNNPTTNGALPQMYNGKGRGLVCISPIIWRNTSWLSDDKRRGPNMAFMQTATGMWFTEKYKDYTNFTDAAPVIRYAEVILNVAEAYCRLANPTDAPVANALLNLNKVRDRALATPATQSYTAASFVDNNALLAAILTERRIEFCMEGRRWPDIHRLMLPIPAKLSNSNPPASAFTLGTPYSGPYGVLSVAYDNYKFLWPIPQVEINANPVLAAQQNPGW
jgi:hypothetical protein